ncbi:hypothetical protein DRO69_07330 [Candidatus Bathyarchaeota archaeon]|nr:MAG: hypothetical protein DRO69_07330 [Candidatus Bathyarchaeota archaeon]
MSARPWKLYLAAIAIICLLVGAAIGWVAKPLVTPFGGVSPEEYDAALTKITEYESMIEYYAHRMTTQPSVMIDYLKAAVTPEGSIWYMLQSGIRPDPDKYPYTELGMPPRNFTGKLVIGTWAGLGRDDPMWWNEGPWGFKQIYPNVTLEWRTFEDEPDLRAKLELDPDWADIIEVCGAQWKLIEAGFLAPLNSSLIPLLAELLPEWLFHYAFWHDSKLHGVNIEWGQSSLAFRTDIFEELEVPGNLWNNWSLLFEPLPELDGKIWMYDSVIEILPSAIAYAAGTDYWDIPLMVEWTLDQEKWAKVEEAMYNFRPKIAKFFTGVEEAYTALQTGVAAGVFCWNDMYAAGALGPDWEWDTGDEVPVAWMLPTPGDSWGTAYCINSRLLERDLELWKVAHAFLNAVLAAEAQANKIMEWFEGAPNKYAWDIAIGEWPELAPIIEEMRLNNTYYYTAECSYWIEPPDEITEIWAEFWLEFKG